VAAKRIFNGVLTADVVTTITADASCVEARVVNMDGAQPIYIRTDGTDPQAPWDDCEALPAAIGFVVVRLTRKGVPSTVKMVSSGNTAYSVKFW
jgi:hypothetical protein